MKAYDEYQRIKHLAAFNIADANRRVINQHVIRYTFEDGSQLDVQTDPGRKDRRAYAAKVRDRDGLIWTHGALFRNMADLPAENPWR